MKYVVFASIEIISVILVVGFMLGLSAHIFLINSIDPGAVQKNTGRKVYWFSQSPFTPIEYYRTKDRYLWRIRDMGFKIFAFSVSLFIFLAIAATVMGAQLEVPK
jgi:hypothetical protein